MNIDEFVISEIDKGSQLRSEINETYTNAAMDNIRQSRSLIIQFILVASGIIGFTIPVVGRTGLIKTQLFLIGGLAELLLIIIFAFWYLTWILQKENNGIEELQTRFNSYMDKMNTSRNKFFVNMNKENFEAWKKDQQEIVDDILTKDSEKKKTKDYSLDIIFSGFFIGLVLIVASMARF